MTKRTGVCQDCSASFLASPKGTLPRRCPPCRAERKRLVDLAWRAENKERLRSIPSARYEVRSQARGSRERSCCVCAQQFTLAKGEHRDKVCFFCPDCRDKHGYCTVCEQVKPADAFASSRIRSLSRDSRCLECKRDDYGRRDRRVRVAARYGLTLQEWTDLAEEQGRRCAVCRRHEHVIGAKGLVVDHCHVTGRVRGLLCSGCNAALGLMRDDETVLRAAIDYLAQHQGVSTPATA